MLQTRAELTSYQETSLHADVMSFLAALAARATMVRAESDPSGAYLSAFAVEQLTREGDRQLDALRFIADDERAAAALSTKAYAPWANGRST